MYRELAIASDVPESKLKRAFKTGTLSLTKDELSGSGVTLHLHPESYAKALRSRKSGKGTRLLITKKEIGYPFKHMQGSGMHGASIWGKVWGGIKSAFKFAKDSGILSRVADAAIPALATALGAPQGAIPARAAIKSMTGIGLYEDAGGRISMIDVKKGAKRALAYTKRKGILTDAVDAGESFLLSKATKPEHGDLIRSIRGEVRRRYGVGVTVKKAAKRPVKFTKGSQEAKDHMAKLRAMRSKNKAGGSKPMVAGSFRL